jgi:hypothetical protein
VIVRPSARPTHCTADRDNQLRNMRKPKETTMKKLFVALTVLTLVFGTVAVAAPANAAHLFQPIQNEGANN